MVDFETSLGTLDVNLRLDVSSHSTYEHVSLGGRKLADEEKKTDTARTYDTPCDPSRGSVKRRRYPLCHNAVPRFQLMFLKIQIKSERL